MEFRTVIELGGKTATGFGVPDEVVSELGSSRRPSVVVTIGSYSYRTTVARMGGRFMIPLAAEHRTAAGVEAGDEIEGAVGRGRQEARDAGQPDREGRRRGPSLSAAQRVSAKSTRSRSSIPSM
jgi:hypothetical protein